MHWIKEVEIAKSVNDLMTSRSITGRKDFTDYKMLDAKFASALKRLSRVCTSEGELVSKRNVLKKTTDSYEGKQIACVIYEYFRVTGAYEVVQGLSGLFNIHLQNDGVQVFDTKWDEALSAAREIPTEIILEGSCKSNLQDSVQLQTVSAMYDQENVRNNGQTKYLRLKKSVKLHIDQTMRTRNFRARNEIVERGAVTKSHKG